jgi:hypothetical protein
MAMSSWCAPRVMCQLDRASSHIERGGLDDAHGNVTERDWEARGAVLPITDGTDESESTVARYRVHFVDHTDRVFDAIEIEHDTDEAAIEEAHDRDVPSIGAGFDVWHEGRLVHKHRR